MECEFPTCHYEATHSTFCFQHFRIYGTHTPKPAPKPIPKKSAKAKIEDKEYKNIVKQLLSENNQCEMKVPGVCTGLAQGLHHKRKRSKHTLKDRKNLIRACNACNLYCETHPLDAALLGLVETKHKQPCEPVEK